MLIASGIFLYKKAAGIKIPTVRKEIGINMKYWMFLLYYFHFALSI